MDWEETAHTQYLRVTLNKINLQTVLNAFCGPKRAHYFEIRELSYKDIDFTKKI